MDKLLEHFGVKNHYELTEYIKSNPDESKVIELKELMKAFGIDLDKEEING